MFYHNESVTTRLKAGRKRENHTWRTQHQIVMGGKKAGSLCPTSRLKKAKQLDLNLMNYTPKGIFVKTKVFQLCMWCLIE